ncbi:MAG: glycoside hydrolase, end-alpha-1,4-polygalactosaminidase [Rhodothermales bacterium]|nr:glycoside hydrolase, end-alpha-1,4-polygalactosaminidase [Rhodothermales bacterium]
MKATPASVPVVLIALILLASCDSENPTDDDGTLRPPMSLQDVEFWGYQIQDVAATGAVDALVASRYDMLVLEPTRTDWSSEDKSFDTAAMVARIKQSAASDGEHRKLVIAYIDIGEAEDWRWYWTWSTDWDCQGQPPGDWPEYILICDPDGWGGNYPVAYWDAAWKDIIIYGRNQDSTPHGDYTSVIDEAIRSGFDGIYLDWVEGFENVDVVARAELDGKDAATEMIQFIAEMRTYARARVPGFLIIQQNAAELIDSRPALVPEIDAIAQEGIWYDGDATDDWNDPDGHDWVNDADLVDYYLDHLQDYTNAGLPVFNCEYALSRSADAYSLSRQHGFIPYVTRRSLGRLTTTPPPSY